LLPDFNETWILSTRSRKKNPQMSIFMKIHSVGAGVLQYRRTGDEPNGGYTL
jgi:hypothetical protein